MMLLTILTLILGVYVFVESMTAFCDMEAGVSQLYDKTKYVFSWASSLAFIWFASGDLLHLISPERFPHHISSDVRWLCLGCSGTLSAFVWPRTAYRIDEYVRNQLPWG